jgi:hypothetical protein
MIYIPIEQISTAAEHALKGPTIDPLDPLRPKTWSSTILSMFDLFSSQLTPFARLFDSIQNKKIILTGLDDAGKTRLMREHICFDRSGRDIATRKPFLGCYVQTVEYPHNVRHVYALIAFGT